MERTLIHGETVEEKLASIEVLLQQFRRRLSTKVIGVVPPVPILHHQQSVGPNGMLFEGIAPFDGTVIRLCLCLSEYASKRPEVHYTIQHTDTTYTLARTVSKEVEVFNIDVPVSVGDIMRIRIDPVDAVGQALVGLLLHPVNDVVNQEKFLLDNFLALEEKEDAKVIRKPKRK